MIAPNRYVASRRRRLTSPALRAFFRIAAKWNLTSSEQRCLLGMPAWSTFYAWKRRATGRLTWDGLERISYVIGIWHSLHSIFADEAQADGWIRRPNSAPIFAGGSALDRMLAGQVAELFVVRQYLSGQVWVV